MKRKKRRTSRLRPSRLRASRARLKSVSSSPPRRVGRGGLKILIGLAVVALLAARLFFFELVRLEGDAMAPTLIPGDVLLLERGRSIALGDVVLIEEAGRSALRRVLAGPGALIGSLEGELTYDGRALKLRELSPFDFSSVEGHPHQRRALECLDEHLCHPILGDYLGGGHSWILEIPEMEVPPGHVFVFCDNRRRCPLDEFSGVVPMAWLTGRVKSRVWGATGSGFASARSRPRAEIEREERGGTPEG